MDRAKESKKTVVHEKKNKADCNDLFELYWMWMEGQSFHADLDDYCAL